jgi:hypothetical protein
MILSVFVGYTAWPNQRPTMTWADLKKLTPASQALLRCDPFAGVATLVLPLQGRPGYIPPPDEIAMPDGEVLILNSPLKESTQRKALTDDYNHVQDRKLLWKRARFLGLIFILWVIPCLAVLSMGLSVRWVLRGFRKDSEGGEEIT